MENKIVTIDGPSGSGKSTISFELSKLLGFYCLYTGNMYRAVAWLNKDKNLSREQLIKTVFDAKFSLSELGTNKTIVNGLDITADIKTPEILSSTSKYASIHDIRECLTQKQRDLAKNSNLVVEGRDSGSHVFPNATYKIYLDADEIVRSNRLYSLLTDDEKKAYGTLENFAAEIKTVDQRDRERKASPLVRLPDMLYHKTGKFTAKEEAVYLFYMITQSDEYISNAKLL